MVKRKVYVAFDYDDLDVKENLIAQRQQPDCPFDLVDSSLNREIPQWQQEARKRIANCECVIVLCGQQTHQATGVITELAIAQELKKPYFLLAGTRAHTPTPPPNACATDKIWPFRWPTVTTLLEGKTPPNEAAVR